MAAQGGLNIDEAGTSSKNQIDSVILAITRKCHYNCQHCYEYLNLAKKDSVPVDKWNRVIADLQKIGVNLIILSGGEPLLRYEDLLVLLESGDKDVSDFHIHTSGYAVSLQKAQSLKKAGLTAAGISLDDHDPELHNTFRGYSGALEESVKAIQYFRQAGVFPYVNVLLQKNLVRAERLWHYLDYVKDLGVGIINLLEPKPAGRFFPDWDKNLFSEEDRREACEFFQKTNRDKKYRDYPFIAYMSYFEKLECVGCLMGGLSHFYIDSAGNVKPCVFVPVTFGNIMEEDFTAIYQRMRKACPNPLHKECPSLSLVDKIKEKTNRGIPLPIPYESIREDWEKMYS
jgi:MoaA/NifB/PqqE/SkfB family radical SAM enzyme